MELQSFFRVDCGETGVKKRTDKGSVLFGMCYRIAICFRMNIHKNRVKQHRKEVVTTI